MCAEKFPLVSMGGRVEGLTCADPGARTPIGASVSSSCYLVVVTTVIKTPEGVVVGFPNFAWAPN